MLDPGQSVPLGIHPSAVIDPSAKLGRNLCIGPFCYIGPNVEIGDDTWRTAGDLSKIAGGLGKDMQKCLGEK